MDDDHDEIDTELLEEMRERQDELLAEATKRQWAFDARMHQCDGCGETHIDEAWMWGQGFVYVGIGCFGVTLKTEPDKTDDESIWMEWQSEDINDVLFLVELLSLFVG